MIAPRRGYVPAPPDGQEQVPAEEVAVPLLDLEITGTHLSRRTAVSP